MSAVDTGERGGARGHSEIGIAFQFSGQRRRGVVSRRQVLASAEVVLQAAIPTLEWARLRSGVSRENPLAHTTRSHALLIKSDDATHSPFACPVNGRRGPRAVKTFARPPGMRRRRQIWRRDF